MEKEEEREDEQDMKVRKKGVGSRELKSLGVVTKEEERVR